MIRLNIRIPPTTLKRYLRQLVLHGVLEKIGYTKKKGIEYILLAVDKYQKLEEKIEKVLEENLQNIKDQIVK